MVGYNTGNSGKHLSAEWHGFRQRARETSYGLSEFGDIAIEKYDLETVRFDRSQKESTHITETHVDVEGGAKGGVDIRKFPTLTYSE